MKRFLQVAVIKVVFAFDTSRKTCAGMGDRGGRSGVRLWFFEVGCSVDCLASLVSWIE